MRSMIDMENGIVLKKTCEACPEQYDAYYGPVKVGYLRLRHGHFTVHCPDHGGKGVYIAQSMGDGAFFEQEREKHLHAAAEAILRWVNENMHGESA